MFFNSSKKEDTSSKSSSELIRVGKTLNELITVTDAAGNIVHKMFKPVMLEIYGRDIMQLIVGATLISIPIAFTEEVWKLGEHLPWLNIILLAILSISFTSLFVYHNFYRNHFKKYWVKFIKRVLLIYIISLAVSLVILFLIDKAPIASDHITTLKRMIIISFPASMSAAVADMIK